jgi:hypothetical protein
MANLTVPICWRPGSATSKVTFLDSTNSPYPNAEIPVVGPTTIRFVTSKACSDNAIYPFKIRIQPTANDIDGINGNESPTVQLNAKYQNINQRANLNMVLVDDATHTPFVIESGKPVIRNDPHRGLQPYVYLVGFALILVAMYALWRWRARRLRDLGG